MSEPINCLQCNSEVASAYCGLCGQKASTHRFSLSEVVFSEFLHGIFHLEKGFFYTLKELLTRPGHSIREYIQGKRAKHFSYFTLLIILVTLCFFVSRFAEVNITQIYEKNGQGVFSEVQQFQSKYPKGYLLLSIPVYSIFSFLFFRKSKLNFAENLVLNSYRTAIEYLFTFLFYLSCILVKDIDLISVLYVGLQLLILLYIIVFYYQFFSFYYRYKSLLFVKTVIVSVLISVLSTLVIIFAFGVYSSS
ncbi:DUF3667 domain-containing protein [Flavobacterium sp. SM15]|uniref:DUF3667 domain-containing protein n=1 Tax=Flavobacterium sp. SM15 TaxID=2908005 RepID=UPI001EDA56F1|nr:DUF3667 domain-containing protein [Flavobacterium sp. SM15]MCG2611957.1 DUF3667 domain-containing protein [Flavobacterium sp. SM15]